MRMWLLAVAVAILGANLISLMGLVDLHRSMYATERFALASYIVGGFLFGVGMTLASGCGSRNLVRLGGGSLKALIVLLCLAVSAYMTMKGILTVPRTHLLEPLALHLQGGQDLSSVLQRLTGLGRTGIQASSAAIIALGLLWFAFKDRGFAANRAYVAAAIVIGLAVAAGWYVTGYVGHLVEDPETLEEVFVATNTKRPESFTYVGPVAFSLEWLLLWTDKSLKITFGIAIVAGLFAGALADALWTRSFRLESFASPADLRNHLVGGALMGFGGVTALGCTIGQGITGVSTLALGSFVAWFAIVRGCVGTNKFLYWRIANDA